MRKLAPAFYVGLVVIAAAAVFVYMFGAVQKSTTNAKNSYVVFAVFDDVSGLAEGSRITMSGIPVGEIREITLDSSSGSKARVELRVDNRVVLHQGERGPDGTIVSGAVVTRRQASLLGDYYLDITRGVAGPPIPPEGEIPTVVSVSGLAAVLDEFEQSGQLFEKLDRIAGNIESVTQSLATVVGGEGGTMRLEGVAQDVSEAMQNIAAATAELRMFVREGIVGNKDSFDRIVQNVEQFTGDAARVTQGVDDSIRRSVANIEAMTGELRGVTERGSGRVENILAALEAASGRIQTSLDALDTALANVGEITRKVNEGEGTIGRLVNDDHLVTSIEETVDDVGGLVKSISRLQTRVELRVEHAVNRGTTKTYVTLKLQPREDRYYAFELIDDPKGRTRWSTRLTETNDPTLPPLLRETTTETTDELKYSLYFAKRFYFLTGRIGIIESTGGVGLDLEFFEDTLKIAVDTFAFKMDTTPRVRSSLSWKLFEHLLVFAGVDDIFDDDGRDYFVGLGLTFTDDDLKALLTVAPMPAL